MYLLVLVAFLHLSDVRPLVVNAYPQAEACQEAARKLNKATLNDTPRREGDVFVCFRIDYPT